MPRLYVGIVYGAQNLFTTECTEDHGGGLGLPLMTLIFGKQVICAGLQSTRVIRRMYKFCQLTMPFLVCDIKAGLTGAAPADHSQQ